MLMETLLYWREVYKESLVEVRQMFGVRGDAVKLATGVIFTTIAFGIFIFLGLVRGFDSAFQLIWAIFGADAVIILMLWLSTPVIAAFRLPIAASHRDLKKLQQIQILEDKWGDEKIKTDYVILIPEEDYTDSGDLRAWLRVQNGEPHDLEDCYGTATKVMVKSSKNWVDKTHEVNKSETELTWPAHGRNTKITIRRNGKSERLSVANLQNGVVYFTHLHTGNKVGDGLQERLYIEIEFNCNIKGKQIQPIVFKGFLVHKKTKKSEQIYLEPGEL